MTVILLLLAGVIFFFGLSLLFGAPYLPTLSKQTAMALDLLDLKPGQMLLELGSGDGRLQLEAAKRGINSLGYELNPILVFVSHWRLRKYRSLAKVKMANFWRSDWPPTDGIYVFLLDRYMLKLHNKVVQSARKPVKLVSFGFRIPNLKPKRQSNGLFLYIIP